MGKKYRKGKKGVEKESGSELLSTPVELNHEFEGIASFEELKSCTFIKINKKGKFKRELWEDGKIIKKKNKKRNLKELSAYGKGENNYIKKQKMQKLPEKKLKVDNVSKEIPKKKKKRRKLEDGMDSEIKKPRYDDNTYHGCKQKDKMEQVDISAWEKLFVPSEVLKALSALGFSNPTEIQRLVLPAAIKGRMDIIGAAETGSGKTLAFGIPIIHGILSDKVRETEMTHTRSEDDSGVENSDQETLEVEQFHLNDCDSVDDEEIVKGENADISYLDSDDDDENSIDNESESENWMDNGSEDESSFDDDSGKELENVDQKFNEEFGCVKVIDNADFDFLKEENKCRNPTLKPLRALIVTPTRELAIQVKSHLASVLVHTDIKMAVVVGGLSSEKQTRILNKGPDIVIGTPGRLWEMLMQGNEHLSQIENIRYLAIDETDRMVEQGHFEELQQLLEKLNTNESSKLKRQNFVFSATLTLVHSAPRRLKMKKKKTMQMTSELKLKQLAKIVGLKPKPKVVDVTRKFGTAESLTESRINCHKNEKDIYLYYFLKQYPGRTLVFCNSIDCVRRLQNLFTILQCYPLSLHACMHQKQRLKSLEKFTSSPKAFLLATDVAARGLDIPNIQHVIHYETPRTAETYIHRSGRTARATQEGFSILFIDSSEMTKYHQLCNTLNRATDLPPFPVDVNVVDQIRKRMNFAHKLESMEHSHRKNIAEENWLKKTALEAGLLLDDDDDDADNDYYEELGIEKEINAAREKREKENMRAELKKMLSLPLISLDFSGKYPTQTGALIMPLGVESQMRNANQNDINALSIMKKEVVEFSKLIKSVKPKTKAPVKKENKKKFKGFEKRRLKMQKEKERREKFEKEIAEIK